MQNFIENMRWVLDHPVYSRIISIVIIILVAVVITRIIRFFVLRWEGRIVKRV